MPPPKRIKQELYEDIHAQQAPYGSPGGPQRGFSLESSHDHIASFPGATENQDGGDYQQGSERLQGGYPSLNLGSWLAGQRSGDHMEVSFPTLRKAKRSWFS